VQALARLLTPELGLGHVAVVDAASTLALAAVALSALDVIRVVVVLGL